MCLQETKWVGEKAKEVEPYGYKLWYTGKDKTKNRVEIHGTNLVTRKCTRLLQ